MEMGDELRDLLKEAKAPRAAGAGEHERDLRGVPGVLTNENIRVKSVLTNGH